MKNMQKSKFIGGLLACCLCGQLTAQMPKMYMRLMGGFHAPLGETNFGLLVDDQGQAVQYLTAETGGGIPITLGTGYMFNKHFGAEVNLQYTKGAYADYFVMGTSKKSVRFDGLYVIPSLIMATGGKKFNFYIKAGFVLPAINRSFFRVNDVDARVGSNQFNVGINGSAGVRWQITRRLALIAELEEVNVKSRLNYVEDVTTGRLVTFVEELNPGAIDQELAYSLSLRRSGFNIGITYTLLTND